MGKKSTQTTVARRVEEVLQIILLGGELHDLVQHASENKWNVGERQLRNYVDAAMEIAKERVEKDRDRLWARHLLQRRTLFARAMEGNDIRTALAVVKDEAELQGLYPADKVEHSGRIATTADALTDEQLTAIAAGQPARGRRRTSAPARGTKEAP